ncbi:MAG: hypothetical protein R6X22_13905 [Gemmatimonadota bacterium]
MIAVVASVIAVIVAVFLLGWSAWSVRRQRRVLGADRYRECLAITRTLGRYSGRIRTLARLKWVALGGGLALLAAQWAGDAGPIPALAALFLLVTGLGQWTRERVPASILVLGSSGEEQISLQAAIRDAVLPFRPVSLLQTGILATDMKIPGDCFRIDRGVDWRDAVSSFARSVALIVLDTRRITPFVQEEILHLTEAGYAFKTVVVGAAGEPSLRSATTVPDTSTALALLRFLLLERETLPSPERPAAVLARERSQGGSAQVAGTPGPPAEIPLSPRTRPSCPGLSPFSFRAPPAWHCRVLAEQPTSFAALLRPPESGGSGLGGIFRRRSRLDFMVFQYSEPTVTDESTFRAATEQNLAARGATITRQEMLRRGGALCHECHFQQGISHGYLVRFITGENEYVVHWLAMDGPTMTRHLGTVKTFVEEIEA